MEQFERNQSQTGESFRVHYRETLNDIMDKTLTHALSLNTILV